MKDRTEYFRQYEITHKDRIRERKRLYYLRNKCRIDERNKKYNAENKGLILAHGRSWYDRNRAKKLAMRKAWARRNPDKVRAFSNQRRSALLLATPKWSEQFFIDEACHLASLRTKATGINWEVDHIVPMNSKIVCGLNTHTNIQVITARMNRSKGNRSWPDMPR